ncbi:epoxyqueuosine reductase QueH [bacterium]|nr:MAG: epoxyqueuosine reductase QueH [bacterium]
MKRLLLHICCGVCSSWPVEKIKTDGYEVVGLFYNPNIQPHQEYLRRLEAIKKVSEVLGFRLIEGAYEEDKWLDRVRGLENEPEGGKRCEVCFRVRLEAALDWAKKENADFFATTLSVSPHKNVQLINSIGKSLSSDKFLEYDFKKADGFKKAIDFSKTHEIYRQNYCGCVFAKDKK